MRVLDITNNFKDVTNNFEIGKSSYWILAEVDEINKIKEFLLLDNESINECIDSNQPSKISFFDGYIFIVFNILHYKDNEVVSDELNIFLSKDYIITIYKQKLDILEDLIKDIGDSKNCFILKDKPYTHILLYYILDRIIVRNYDVISSLEVQIDKVEIRILKSPRSEQIGSLIHLRRQVYEIRKYLNPLRYIGDSLSSNDNFVIDPKDIRYFINIENKINKLMLSLESLVQDLALVREAFEAEISNKTNELIKVFTLIATIFLPLNLISSLQGMNVRHVPFAGVDFGYYHILVIMLLIALLLIMIFKKHKWL
ncbi:MAG: magnesium transporter CorA family protein [Bacillota bacterium]|nr:magnesium transporter CorA family protein [Bacillota bacterium]